MAKKSSPKTLKATGIKVNEDGSWSFNLETKKTVKAKPNAIERKNRFETAEEKEKKLRKLCGKYVHAKKYGEMMRMKAKREGDTESKWGKKRSKSADDDDSNDNKPYFPEPKQQKKKSPVKKIVKQNPIPVKQRLGLDNAKKTENNKPKINKKQQQSTKRAENPVKPAKPAVLVATRPSGVNKNADGTWSFNLSKPAPNKNNSKKVDNLKAQKAVKNSQGQRTTRQNQFQKRQNQPDYKNLQNNKNLKITISNSQPDRYQNQNYYSPVHQQPTYQQPVFNSFRQNHGMPPPNQIIGYAPIYQNGAMGNPAYNQPSYNMAGW